MIIIHFFDFFSFCSYFDGTQYTRAIDTSKRTYKNISIHIYVLLESAKHTMTNKNFELHIIKLKFFNIMLKFYDNFVQDERHTWKKEKII